jgi:hypothetical protein
VVTRAALRTVGGGDTGCVVGGTVEPVAAELVVGVETAVDGEVVDSGGVVGTTVVEDAVVSRLPVDRGDEVVVTGVVFGVVVVVSDGRPDVVVVAGVDVELSVVVGVDVVGVTGVVVVGASVVATAVDPPLGSAPVVSSARA